jgi:hypothetical protein
MTIAFLIVVTMFCLVLPTSATYLYVVPDDEDMLPDCLDSPKKNAIRSRSSFPFIASALLFKNNNNKTRPMFDYFFTRENAKKKKVGTTNIKK